MGSSISSVVKAVTNASTNPLQNLKDTPTGGNNALLNSFTNPMQNVMNKFGPKVQKAPNLTKGPKTPGLADTADYAEQQADALRRRRGLASTILAGGNPSSSSPTVSSAAASLSGY